MIPSNWSSASFTKAYTAATYVNDTTFTYVESIINSSNVVVSATTKTAFRTVGHDVKVIRYTYNHLGLVKVKLYSPANADSHLFHDIFSTYSNSDDFVAYPIYPLMLDGVYIDNASRKEEYDDAQRLLRQLSFPMSW